MGGVTDEKGGPGKGGVRTPLDIIQYETVP